jgi:hypothetical protein
MKVSELIEELQKCDPEREVYSVGVGGDWEKVREVEPEMPHEKLSIVPYEEEDFVGLK